MSTPVFGDGGSTARHGLDSLRFTLSVSPAHVRGGLDLLATDRIRRRLATCAARIHDINFTCRVTPFVRDAHGVFVTREENEAHLRQMLALQQETGITVSAVFNDVLVPNTEEELRRFVGNLRPLVERGLRSISVPHVLWMKMGLLQKAFPDLRIKNTVLREVLSGQDFWNHAEAGYDYVNLDRRILRDRAALAEVREAQQAFEQRFGKHVETAVIHGEGCVGNCALIPEHYHHTLSHPHVDENVSASLEVFRLPTEFSCRVVGHPNVNLPRNVGLPCFADDAIEVCAYFDIVKLAGRRSYLSIGDALDALEHLGETEGPFLWGIPPEFPSLLSDPEAGPLLERWRRVTRTCRYQCWRCSLCTELGAYLA